MIKTNLSKITQRMVNLKNNIEQGNQSFFRTNKKDIEITAQMIVKQVVYDVYNPKIYIRTYKLIKSVTVQLLEEGGISIFINPEGLSPMLGSRFHSSGHIYPIYVMKGEWIWEPVSDIGKAPRDFLRTQAGWTITFKKVIPPKYYREVMNKAIKERGVSG